MQQQQPIFVPINSNRFIPKITFEKSSLMFLPFGYIQTYLLGILENDSSRDGSKSWFIIKMVNWTMRCLMIATYIYWSGITFFYLLEKIKSQEASIEILVDLALAFYRTECFLMSIMIIRRNPKIRSLMENISQHLRNDESSNLRWINHLFTFIHLSSVIFLCTFSCIISWIVLHDYVLSFALILYYIYMPGLAFRFILSYIFINYSMAKAFPSHRFISNSPPSLIQIKNVKNMVKTHRQLRQEINSLVGFIPLITLSITFLYSVLHFIRFMIEKIDSNRNLYFWTDYFMLLGFNILMMIALGQMKTDHDCYFKIIEWISENCKKEKLVFSQNYSEQLYLSQERQIFISYINSLIANPI